MIPYLIASAAIGYFESILFSVCDWGKLRRFNHTRGDIHRHFVAVRIALYLWAYGFTWIALIQLLPAMLMFPLIHDGAYYIGRHYIETGTINVMRFTHHTTTSTAVFSFSFWKRVVMFVIGSVMWVLI
jgi:hypothetical protein